MVRYNKNETFLADWIEGNMSDFQLRRKVSSDDYESFILLRNRLQHIHSPVPDLDFIYQQLVQKKSMHTISKVKYPFPVIKFSAVAVFLLFFTSLVFYHYGILGKRLIETNSEQQNISIGENVDVRLYENSAITQNAPMYNVERIILNYGEAYFEVLNGTPFSIETVKGTIQVLGTKFTVRIVDNQLKIRCFEGKVKVKYEGVNFYIRAGEMFNSISQEVIKLEEEQNDFLKFVDHYKKFEMSSLTDVVKFLEVNYGVVIELPTRIKAQKFTGTLPVDDLDTCLELLSKTFKMNYTKKKHHVFFTN